MSMDNSTTIKIHPRSRLNRQLALRIVLFSSMVTIVTTLLQLWTDYRSNVGQLTEQQSYIGRSYIDTLEASVWTLNEELIQRQVEGIARLPGFTFVQVNSRTGQQWQAGKHTEGSKLQTHFTLGHRYLNNQLVTIGTLDIESDLWPVYENLARKAGLILLFNGIKTFIVAAFILLLVRRLITDPLARIADHFAQRPNEMLHLFRHRAGRQDEIDQLASQLSGSYAQLADSLDRIRASERKLEIALADRERLLRLEQGYKSQLEYEVNERTRELEQTVERMGRLQGLLVERERLASLGRMLAGLAQQVDGPLDRGLDAARELTRGCTQLRSQLPRGSELDRIARDLEDQGLQLQNDLRQTHELTNSFKQAALDRGGEPLTRFHLATMIEEAVRPEQEFVDLQCPIGLWLEGYKGALTLALRHLVGNAFTHAYAGRQPGRVQILVRQLEDDTIELKVEDTGRGIDPALQSRIFDPFFTTQLGLGGKTPAGTGLGLYVVHNIIVGQFGGTVRVQSMPGTGAAFILRFPRNLDPRAHVLENLDAQRLS